jgi:hypothetical protein
MPHNETAAVAEFVTWNFNEWVPSLHMLLGTYLSVVAVMLDPPDQPSVVFDSKFQLAHPPQVNWAPTQ